MTQAPNWTRTPGHKAGHAFHANGATSSSAYAEAALGAECLSVATAQKGSRNDTLNRAAFGVGQLIAGMEIDETTARRRLEGAALAAGLDPIEIASTINSGFLAGAAEPRMTPKNGKAAEQEMRTSEPDMSIISRNAMPAPPFPREVLGLAASWCEDEARSKNVPFDFVALGLLTATAGLIGPKRRASPWSGWTEPAILWGVHVGPPSIGKSPAIDSVRDAVGILEREQNSDWRDRSAEYEESRKVHEAKQSAWEDELAAAAKKGHAPPPMPRGETPTPPTRRRLWTGDTTTEMLVRLLAENPSGLIAFRDELSGMFGAFDKYGGSGSDRAFWLEAYGGRAYRYDRVSLKEGGLDVPFCAVSLIGGIQPDKLQEMVLGGADDGLAARFLYSWPDVTAPKRPTRVADQTLLVSALRRVADIKFAIDGDGNLQPVTLSLEPDAADEFQAWYERTQWNAKLDATGKIAGAIGKLDGVCLRLALVLEHLAWSWSQSNRTAPEQITLGSLQGAVRLIDEWTRGNLARVFSEASIPDEMKDVQEVARWIQAHRAENVNARALRRTSGFVLKNVKRLDAALDALVDARWLSPIVYTGPDRRRKDFEVDQRIYKPVPDANRANHANRSSIAPD